MAKDYTIPKPTLEEVSKAYRWYRKCGDTRERALEHACIAVHDLRKGPTWMLPRLLKHMKTGRCGGNADEALQALLVCVGQHPCPNGH